MFLRRFSHAGAIIFFVVRNRKHIRVHVGEKERMRVNDGGIVVETITSTAVALTLMDVLIRRQKEGKDQRQTSLESNYTPHDWAEYVLDHQSNSSPDGRLEGAQIVSEICAMLCDIAFRACRIASDLSARQTQKRRSLRSGSIGGIRL